jgi:hypothetical protein
MAGGPGYAAERSGELGRGVEEMIGQAIAHYRITAKIGKGGIDEVYRATDTKLGRHPSVMIAGEIRKRLAEAGYRVKEAHRDLLKK